MKCEEILCVFLIEADVFNKAIQVNIPKSLRNLCTQFNEYIKVLWRNGLCRKKNYILLVHNSDIANYTTGPIETRLEVHCVTAKKA